MCSTSRRRPTRCAFSRSISSAPAARLPETLLDAVEREKEIRYSSRTRLNTDMMRQRNELRCSAQAIAAQAAEEFARRCRRPAAHAESRTIPQSPSSSSSTASAPMKRMRATMNSRACRSKSTGSRAARMSSKRCAMNPGAIATSRKKASRSSISRGTEKAANTLGDDS